MGARDAAKRIRRIRQPDGTEEVPSPQSEPKEFASQTGPKRFRRRKANPKNSPARRDRGGPVAAKRIRRIRQQTESARMAIGAFPPGPLEAAVAEIPRSVR
jgi:hypothetical protein